MLPFIFRVLCGAHRCGKRPDSFTCNTRGVAMEAAGTGDNNDKPHRQISPRAKKRRVPSVKRKMVVDAIQKINLPELRALALSSDGLVDDHLRRDAWMLLLEISRDLPLAEASRPVPSSSLSWFAASGRKALAKHDATLRQIELDVNRSYSHLQAINSPLLEIRRRSLSILLAQFFARNADLYYYQGFHDVAAVCQDVMRDSLLALAVLERLSRFFVIRDAHRKEFDATDSCLHAVLELVRIVDADLGALLARTSPYWAVSMVITLFAHDLSSHEAIARVFGAPSLFGGGVHHVAADPPSRLRSGVAPSVSALLDCRAGAHTQDW